MAADFSFRLIQFGLMHIWPALVMLVSASFLNTHDVSSVAIIVSVATLVRPLIGMSLGRAGLRFVGERSAHDNNFDVRAAVWLVFGIALLASIVALGGLFFIIAATLHIYDIRGGLVVFILIVAFCYLYGLTELLDGIFRIERRFKDLAFAMIASRTLAIASFCLWLPFSRNIETLLLVLAGSEGVCVFALILRFWQQNGSTFAAARKSMFESVRDVRKLLRYSLPIIINAVAVYFYARVMALIIALHAPPEAVGSFELSAQLTNLPMAFTIVVATTISPRAAHMYAKGGRERQKLRVLLSQGASLALWVGLVCTSFFMIVGPVALKANFAQLSDASEILMIISPLVAIKAFAQILSGEISVAVGKAKTVAQITILYGILNVVAGYAGVRSAGAVGAAFAMLVVHSAASFTSVYVLNRQTGLALRYRWLPSLAGTAVGSVPAAIYVIASYAHFPADPPSALAATALLLLGQGTVLLASLQFRWPVHRPIVDGIRLLFPGRPKYSPPANHGALPLDSPCGAISTSVNRYLRTWHAPLAEFWEGRCNTFVPGRLGFMAHADYIYAKWLLGEEAQLHPLSVEIFANAVKQANLAGGCGSGPQLPPHLTAYMLGALNILESANFNVRAPVYDVLKLDLDKLVDRRTGLPRWPRLWSHHSWRVSHWFGGTGAILLNFARYGRKGLLEENMVQRVLDACELHIITPDTGLMRAYRSNLLQQVFRQFYKVRHNPDFADIGGVAHIHWVSYALDRDYPGARSLLNAAARDLRQTYPFMEGSPYCLDFDYLHLERTAMTQVRDFDGTAIKKRSLTFIRDLVSYLSDIPVTYKLHRLPGALAALHEAAMIAGMPVVPGVGIETRDIIKTALWL